MGRCPFCMAATMPEDVICFSCGRVISGTSGMSRRSRGDFRSSSTRGAKKGMSPRMAAAQASGKKLGQPSVKQLAISRARKGSMKNLVMVGVVTFVFLFTPAQDQLVDMMVDLESEVMNQFKAGREYPVEADYSYSKTFTVSEDNSEQGGAGGTVSFTRYIPIPLERTTRGVSTSHFTAEPGSGPFDTELLQNVKSVEVRTEGQTISIPLDGTARSKNNALTMPSGNLVYWPAPGSEGSCVHTKCVIWQGQAEDGESFELIFEVQISAKSWTWWQDSSVNSDVEGKSWGINVENSGTYSDMKSRAGGSYWNNFGKYSQWHYSDYYNEYLINSNDPLVISTSQDINASLPADLSDNVYAYARASYDYLVEKVAYDNNAPLYPRSGAQCLELKTGDCDEVSNAWMSLLRVKEIPTWYEFGLLLNTQQNAWEGHAWANIMLPMSDSWCQEKGISIDSCFIEGEVDVVNAKWLLHTPTSVTDWIEESDPSGNSINSAYSGWSFTSSGGGRAMYGMSIETTDGPDYIGGTYVVPVSSESF